LLARLVGHHARYAGMPKLACSSPKPPPRKAARKRSR
jgi:hypothetical protein